MFDGFSKLLKKQISKFFPDSSGVEEKVTKLLEEINQTYIDFEKSIEDLKMAKMADEEKNKALQKELKYQSDKDKSILEDLKAALLVLDEDNPSVADADDTSFLSRVLVDLIAKHSQVEEKLKSRTQEMELLNKVMIGRELKMVELKKQIISLQNRVKELEGS